MAPNLPSPQPARGRSRPWRQASRGPGEALRCGAMYGVSLCGTRRSAALLAPRQASSGRRKGDTAHSPAGRGSLTVRGRDRANARRPCSQASEHTSQWPGSQARGPDGRPHRGSGGRRAWHMEEPSRRVLSWIPPEWRVSLCGGRVSGEWEGCVPSAGQHMSPEHDWPQKRSPSAGWSVARQTTVKPLTDVVPSGLEVSL